MSSEFRSAQARRSLIFLLINWCTLRCAGELVCSPGSGPAASPSEFLLALTDPKHYDKLQRPTAAIATHNMNTEDIVKLTAEDMPPDKLSFDFSVVGLWAVDTKAGFFMVSGYLREYWQDQRLAWNSSLAVRDDLPAGCFDSLHADSYQSRIWMPDTYIDNAVSTSKGEDLVLLSPDGSFWKSQFIVAKLKCGMVLKKMPFDSHTCSLVLTTYSMGPSVVQIAAKFPTKGLDVSGLAPSVEWKYSSQGETYTGFQAGEEVGSLEPTGEWQYLHLQMGLKRKPMYFVQSFLLPAILFVLVSYSGFFIARTAVPARVAISVIPILTMLNLLNQLNSKLPPSSDPLWLSTFMVINLFFSAISAFQYGAVSFFMNIEALREERLTIVKKISKEIKVKAAKAPGTAGPVMEAAEGAHEGNGWSASGAAGAPAPPKAPKPAPAAAQLRSQSVAVPSKQGHTRMPSAEDVHGPDVDRRIPHRLDPLAASSPGKATRPLSQPSVVHRRYERQMSVAPTIGALPMLSLEEAPNGARLVPVTQPSIFYRMLGVVPATPAKPLKFINTPDIDVSGVTEKDMMMLNALFQELDTDGDQTLTYVEWRRGFRLLGLYYSPKQVKQMLKEAFAKHASVDVEEDVKDFAVGFNSFLIVISRFAHDPPHPAFRKKFLDFRPSIQLDKVFRAVYLPMWILAMIILNCAML